MRGWTTVRSKYNATCPRCECGILVGDVILWKQGRPAQHAECSSFGRRQLARRQYILTREGKSEVR